MPVGNAISTVFMQYLAVTCDRELPPGLSSNSVPVVLVALADDLSRGIHSFVSVPSKFSRVQWRRLGWKGLANFVPVSLHSVTIVHLRNSALTESCSVFRVPIT